jgi:adenylate cyclase
MLALLDDAVEEPGILAGADLELLGDLVLEPRMLAEQNDAPGRGRRRGAVRDSRPVTPDDYAALGLYDPSTDAVSRVVLLDYLVELGATAEDLRGYAKELPGLASVLAIRVGSERLTGPEVAERAGISYEEFTRIGRALGLAEAPPDARVYTEANVESARLAPAAAAIFGEDAVLQLSRVVGSSMARIADALVSAFLINVELPLHETEDMDLSVARANAAAGMLLPGFLQSMEVTFRQHLLAARRSLVAFRESQAAGFETQHLAVGFADLVDSTGLAASLLTTELGRALTAFEAVTADTVVRGGGRLVKFLGDGALFTAPDARTAGRLAIALRDACAADPVIPAVRVGIAAGEVLTKDGDCFGPVVNLAARAVSVAPPGEVAVTAAVRDAAPELGFEPLGAHVLKGFADPVPLHRLTGHLPEAGSCLGRAE